MKRYGLIGTNIRHSFSPAIQNFLIEHFNLPNTNYFLFDVDANGLEKLISEMKSCEAFGFNVTAPFKSLAFQLFDCEKTDDIVKEIGVANVLSMLDKRCVAYNTDVFGIEKTFAMHKVDLHNANVLVIGAGGIARAIVYAVRDKANRIFVANRTIDNAYDLMKLSNKVTPLNLSEIYDIKNIDVAIQATSISNSHFDLPKTEFVFDTLYSPRQTAFTKRAATYGSYVINGFDLLFYQAVKSFEIWHGVSVNAEAFYNQMRSVYEQTRLYDD